MSALQTARVWIRRAYRRMFSREEDARTRVTIEVLQRVPLFGALPRSVVRDLAETVHRRRYRPDETIYIEDDPGLGLYVVEEGRVVLTTRDEAGTPQDVREVAPDDLFGELSLLCDGRRLATATALTESYVLGLFRPDLKNIVKRNPKAGALLLQTLARHVAEQQTDLLQRMADREGKLAAMRLLEPAELDATP